MKLRASELERERDEAREAASASRDAYEELEERAAHGRTGRLATRLKVAAAVLLVLLVPLAISILVCWLLVR